MSFSFTYLLTCGVLSVIQDTVVSRSERGEARSAYTASFHIKKLEFLTLSLHCYIYSLTYTGQSSWFVLLALVNLMNSRLSLITVHHASRAFLFFSLSRYERRLCSIFTEQKEGVAKRYNFKPRPNRVASV